MLDLYSDSQPIIYKILKNSLTKNQLSHAYLFESNGNGQAYDVATAFAKTIFCPYKYMNSSKCVDCTQCVKIDKNEFSEFSIIEPDGLWIKKEQLDILQKKFGTKGVESEKRVYIINHAEKMNASAANSILKFLEEPEPNIIAILIADNRYQLLDTIVSRCQVVSFHNSNYNDDKSDVIIRKLISNSYIDTISDEELMTYIESLIKFVAYLEEHKLDTILYTDKYFHSIFSSKDLILFAFDTMILYYKDVISKKCNVDNILFKEYINDLEKVSSVNSIDLLLFKIDTLLNLKKNVYVNANTNLLIDRLIIEFNKGE